MHLIFENDKAEANKRISESNCNSISIYHISRTLLAFQFKLKTAKEGPPIVTAVEHYEVKEHTPNPQNHNFQKYFTAKLKML